MRDVMCFKDKGCGSNFIMTSSPKADKLPRPEFSSCSLKDIKANLDLVTRAPNCLQEDDTRPLEVSVSLSQSQGYSRHPHSVCIYIALMFLILMGVY